MKNANERNFFRKMELEGTQDGYTYYENEKVLSYAFVIDDDNYSYVSEGKRIDENNIYYFDHFEYQNEMFKTMNSSVLDTEGFKKDIFHRIPLKLKDSSSFTYELDKNGYYLVTANKGTTLRFEFDVPAEANGNNLYFYDKNETKSYSVYLDNRYYENNTYWHEGIRGFNDNTSHHHTLTYTLKTDVKNTLFRPFVYYEDLTTLSEYLDSLRDSASYDLEQKNGFFSFSYIGTLNVKKGKEDKTLLFTLPNERGMSVYIDNKKQKVVTRMNIFTAVDYSSLDEGEHKIEIRYTDIGFEVGFFLSLLSIGALVAFLLLDYRKRKSVIH